MGHRNIVILSACFLYLLVFSIFTVQAQTPQQTLSQYIADLQKNPNDNALREKIIKYVHTMKQKPAVPEEARRHFVKAVTMQKEAKDIKGFELAASAYSQALLIAPWWADAHYNRGLALESANQYDEAVKALKFYLLTNPSTSELRAAQDKIYALEAKKEMAQVKTETPVEKPKDELDVSGRWRDAGGCSEFFYTEYRLDGDKLYTTKVIEDKMITVTNCQGFSNYRGQKREGITFIRSGKNEFRHSDSVLSTKLEFIGDKVFWTLTVFCCSEQNGSGIQTRER